mgnify:CR=1 FL=1
MKRTIKTTPLWDLPIAMRWRHILDEDWTIEHWGSDAEAEARREARYGEFASAASLFAALQPAS